MPNQKTIQGRDLVNNVRIYRGVVKGMTMMLLACANISNRYNAIFGTDDLNYGMISTAIRDSSIGGCINAKKYICRNIPSNRWYASAIKWIDQNKIRNALSPGSKTVCHPQKTGEFQKTDLLLQSTCISYRYDKVPGEELTRSKSKSGTTYFVT